MHWGDLPVRKSPAIRGRLGRRTFTEDPLREFPVAAHDLKGRGRAAPCCPR